MGAMSGRASRNWDERPSLPPVPAFWWTRVGGWATAAMWLLGDAIQLRGPVRRIGLWRPEFPNACAFPHDRQGVRLLLPSPAVALLLRVMPASQAISERA